MNRPTFHFLLTLAVCGSLLAGCAKEPASDATPPDAAGPPSLEQRVARGEAVFNRQCVACHMASGQGIPGAFPPLAGSDFLHEYRDKSIAAVVAGLAGPITVNGVQYNGVMPSFAHLSDADIAAVLSYVFTSWGNTVEPVETAEVAAIRAAQTR